MPFIQIEIDTLEEIVENYLKDQGLTIAATTEIELDEKENCIRVHLETIKKEGS